MASSSFARGIANWRCRSRHADRRSQALSVPDTMLTESGGSSARLVDRLIFEAIWVMRAGVDRLRMQVATRERQLGCEYPSLGEW